MTSDSRLPLAWTWVLPSAAAALALQALSSGPLAYGYMSDELYYLDCAAHLAFGYVDHPPLSIAVLAVAHSLLGDSLAALHLLPALAHAAAIVLIAALARELGGGRAAQGLAALGALVCPVYLADASFYSMNAFEPPIWALAYLLVARIANGASHATWLWLGVVLGLGLLNKISVLWFGFGLTVGLALTPERRWLVTRWPLLCAGIAFLLFAPHIVWQIQNGWPTLEFMHNATVQKMTHKSPLALLLEQLLVMNPLAAPLWLAGLALLFSAGGARHRILGWIWSSVLALLVASGSARSNYSGPAYAALFAAGGVAWERMSLAPRGRLAPAAIAVLLALGLSVAPLAMPLIPPERYAGYVRAIGIEPPKDQTDSLGELPLHLALRFGGPPETDAVVRAYESLAPEEKSLATILAFTFGDAGALNFFGRARGLPRAVSGHNNYWLWGPGERDPRVVIALAGPDADLGRYFESVERVGEVDCRFCLPMVDRYAVFVCRGLRRPIDEIWPELKNFI